MTMIKRKMIRIQSRLWANSDKLLTIRTEQSKLGNWTPELNNAEFKVCEKNFIRLQRKLKELKKKYPISFLEILPNAVEKPKLPIDQIEECEKENMLNYYGGRL